MEPVSIPKKRKIPVTFTPICVRTKKNDVIILAFQSRALFFTT